MVDRTVTAFYARTGGGSCSVVLKRDTTTVGTMTATTSSTNALVTNTSIGADEVITLTVSSLSSSPAPTDLIFSMEYTQ